MIKKDGDVYPMEDVQEIKLCLPGYVKIPADISQYSKEENTLLLLIGINAVEIVKNEYVNKDQAKINQEIERKIRDSYSRLVLEKDRKYQELEEVNVNLKKTFEDATMTTMSNYCEKIQEKIYHENTKIAGSYERQLEGVRDELKKYQEKLQVLEKENTKLGEQLHYSEKEYHARLEMERFNIKKQTEGEMNATVEDYKKKIDDMKEFVNQYEIQMMRTENQKIQDLGQQCRALQDELMKTKMEYNEFVMKIECEKNEKLSTTVEQNATMLQESMKMIEDLKKQKNTSNILKGIDGENYVYNLFVEVFGDFEDFDIKKTASTPHSADMLMSFKQFSVLVDSKNYSNGVDKKEIVKLEKDISNNKHVKIAWLVSLNTSINGFSKYPVMYDIKDNVCYCYINSLCKQENPQHFIKSVWYSCCFVFEKILNVPSGEELLEKYVKNEERIKVLVDKLMKKSKERYATMKQLTENFDETDAMLREILSGEIMSVHEIHLRTIRTWWEKNIVPVENGLIKSKKIYEAFIRDDAHQDCGINFEQFKHIIKEMVAAENIIATKTARGDYTLKGVGLPGVVCN